MKEIEQLLNFNTQNDLTTMKEPGILPHQLDLKVGYVCALTRNLSIDKTLVKNARVIITYLCEFSLLG